MNELGQMIKAMRESKGIAQWKLAQEIGMSPTTIFRIERGDGTLRRKTFLKIITGLDLSEEETEDLNVAYKKRVEETVPRTEVRGDQELDDVIQRLAMLKNELEVTSRKLLDAIEAIADPDEMITVVDAIAKIQSLQVASLSHKGMADQIQACVRKLAG